MDNDKLADLHTKLIDAREGYRKGIEKAETPAVADLLRSVDQLHAAAHGDVHRMLTARGEKVDEDGSFMGSVHKAAISVRSAVTGIDDGSLSSFASGEEHILDAYDSAIADETDAGASSTLRGHRDRLSAKVSEMRSVAKAA